MASKKIQYVDDDKESVSQLILLRVPALGIGLLLGILLSIVTASFEEVLTKNVAVAYFIPFIVYISDAVGTQTQSVYIRDLRTKNGAHFKRYLFKESALGLALGMVFGVISCLIVTVMFRSAELSAAVGISVFGAVASAPLIALVVTELLQLEHTDPAATAGPLATVIQDAVSVFIYGVIASLIILR